MVVEKLQLVLRRLNTAGGRVARRLRARLVKPKKPTSIPVEIATELKRVMDAEARLMSHTTRIVPSRFLVTLSDADYPRFDRVLGVLIDELRDELRAYAAANGYEFAGPIEITLAQSQALHPSTFKVASTS